MSKYTIDETSKRIIETLKLNNNVGIRITDKPSIEIIGATREDVYKVAEYLDADPEVMLEENYYECDYFNNDVLDIFNEKYIDKLKNI